LINAFNKERKARGDVLLLILVVLLTIIGTIFIYSASSYSAKSTYKDEFYFVKKQVIGIVIGLIVMLVISRVDYQKLQKLALIFSILSVVFLAVLFIPGVGVENYGATRWISLGLFTFQPSELAKFSLILFSATYVSNRPQKITTFLGILPVLIYGAMLCVLIMLEPNMSITVCVALIMLTMLFVGGVKVKHLLMIILPLVFLLVLLILIEPYRLKRLLAFINPWANPKGEGYQLLQSLYALGSGGLFGVGLFNSRQKYSFLPFAESDFILSVIGEEIGFFGLFLFFLLLFLIIIKGLIIASKAKDVFGFMLSIGISMIFGIQVLVNALVVTGSIPPTGLSLPLVSSGNTSIIVFMAEMGVLVNVSKSRTLTF
jgi:cell division protein FtsW